LIGFLSAREYQRPKGCKFPALAARIISLWSAGSEVLVARHWNHDGGRCAASDFHAVAKCAGEANERSGPKAAPRSIRSYRRDYHLNSSEAISI
jgi:hypothetical protein